MGVIEFSEAYKQAVQAGQAIEGNVVKIIADNGDEIGQGVFTVVNGGNGNSSSFWRMVQAGVSGAITTGMSFLTLPLPTFFASVAPALGIVAGTTIYQVMANDPGFSDRLMAALRENGKTIGNKVIAYFNGDNTFWDKETIEIVKNLMYEDGIFRDPFPDPSQTGDVRVESYMTGTDFAAYLMSRRAFTFAEGVKNQFLNEISQYPDYIPYGRVYVGTDRFEGASPLSVNLFPYSDIVTIGGTSRNARSVSTSGSYAGGDNPFVIRSVSEGSASASPLTIGETIDGDWIIASGLNTISNAYVQPGATLPSDEDISITYQSWIPWHYPIPDPSGLPDLYPTKFPGIGDDPYPEQVPAQNPQPEIVPIVFPIIIPSLPLPYPIPIPPTPEIDPEPQPEPDDIEPDPDTPKEPDPEDPNPDPPPSPIIPVPGLPATVDSNKLFTVYNPTSSQLDALGGYLWDSSIIAAIRDIWQDPLDGIISLQQVFATPVTGRSSNIILGFLDTGIGSSVVTQQFASIDCGTLEIKEQKKNSTDYAPYTSLHIYLPFIGIVELDTNECMDCSINVKYKVDMYTGTCLATISITRTVDMPHGPILYTYSGNCSQQLPLTSGNATGVLGALIGAVSAGLSAASGGGLSTLAGAQLLGNSLTHDMMHVSHSGNISANAGIMGNKKPYLIIGRRHCYDANMYNTFYGYPANKTIILSNHSGFARVKDGYVKTSATQEEYDKIMEYLKDGVFI